MTKIIYQGTPGAYMHKASLVAEKGLNQKVDEIVGYQSFEQCWNSYTEDDIMVLAIENSYAGSIYENLYRFLKYDVKIIGEHNMEINHCLCSHESETSKITKVYSHFKALPQCYDYLKMHNIEDQIIYPDTAGSAKMLSETHEKGAAAICSKLAGEMYGLNILEENIQDQKGNTTRFLLITARKSQIEYKDKAGKVSVIFDLKKNIPAILYKCLGAFATNGVNLTKIESLPDIKNPFSYIFWVDFEGKLGDQNVVKSLEELEFFTNEISILGEY